jgi:predicted O-methyltransferase YrrM
MNWLRVSRRVTLLGVAIMVAIAVAGVASAIVTSDPQWLILASIAAVVVLMVLFSKSAHNALAELSLRIVAVERAVGLDHVPAGTSLDLLRRDLQRDVSALFTLHALASPRRYVPPPGGWAATPDTLVALVSEVADGGRSQLVVECGSGTSTAWLGLALARSGGRLVSLEHSAEFAAATNRTIERLSLTSYVDVRQADLTPTQIGGSRYEWFPEDVYADLRDIDLLFVDGPPGHLAEDARYPAIPLLASRLRDGALVVLDDIDRPAEQRILANWLAEKWGGVSLEVEIRTDRAVFIRARRDGA